ncbi:MAG: sporulation protein [Lawsonibacter sp.]|jgi:sporulation protein YqfC|nr:sporulation protein [Lawsonibacter sp.]MCI9567403.1 sporulation protein [Lawsonibacter sp.]
MERKPRRLRFLERTAEMFDLPADGIAGVPRLELVGDGELRVENHKGILAYGREEIHISGGIYLIKISGQDLELRAMTGIELLITGKIAQIVLT